MYVKQFIILGFKQLGKNNSFYLPLMKIIILWRREFCRNEKFPDFFNSKHLRTVFLILSILYICRLFKSYWAQQYIPHTKTCYPYQYKIRSFFHGFRTNCGTFCNLVTPRNKIKKFKTEKRPTHKSFLKTTLKKATAFLVTACWYKIGVALQVVVTYKLCIDTVLTLASFHSLWCNTVMRLGKDSKSN